MNGMAVSGAPVKTVKSLLKGKRINPKKKL